MDMTHPIKSLIASDTSVHAKLPSRPRLLTEQEGSSDDENIIPNIFGPRFFARLLKRAAIRSAKGFAFGTSVQMLLSLSQSLLRCPTLRAFFQSFYKLECATNAVRMGLFVGSFLGIYETGMAICQAKLAEQPFLRADQREDVDSIVKTITIISGAAAGLSLILAPKSVRIAVAMSLGVRSMALLCDLLVQRGAIPGFPHADVLIMSLSSAIITHDWMFNRSTLTASFRQFLDKSSGHQRIVFECYRQCIEKAPISPLQLETLNLVRSNLRQPALSLSTINTCTLLHPDTASCLLASIFEVIRGSWRLIPLYSSAYFIPLVLFKYRKLFAEPIRQLLYTLFGIARSSLFIGCYMSAGWLSSCLLRKVGLQIKTPAGLITGLTAGSCLFIEDPSRRMELSLYTLSQAIHCLIYRSYILGKNNSVRLPSSSSLAVAAFIASTSFTSYMYAFEPSVLRPGYLKFLQLAIGPLSTVRQIKP